MNRVSKMACSAAVVGLAAFGFESAYAQADPHRYPPPDTPSRPGENPPPPNPNFLLVTGSVLANNLAVFENDQASFPEGISGFLDQSFIPAAPPTGTPGEIIETVVDSDNPQVVASIAPRPQMSTSWQWEPDSNNDFRCAPLAGTVGGPTDYTYCKQYFNVTDTAGVDRVWIVANPSFTLQNRGGFFSTMSNSGNASNVFTPTYTNYPLGVTNHDGADPFFFFRGCVGSTDPMNCPGVTFPLLFPSLHLPLDSGGMVQPIDIAMRAQSTVNGSDQISQLGSVVRVEPSPNLVVVPVHLHLFLNNGIDAQQQQTVANRYATWFDDVGAVSAFHVDDGESPGAQYAELSRPVGQLLYGGIDKWYHVCGIQFRLVSVQFHPVTSALLKNGQLDVDIRDGKGRWCETIAQSEPLGQAAVGFAQSLPPGTPQGIHVLLVHDVLLSPTAMDPSASGPEGGYACETTVGSTSVRMAFVALDRAVQADDETVSETIAHEMAHTLGVVDPVPGDAIQNRMGFSSGACQTMFQEAVQVVQLPE